MLLTAPPRRRAGDRDLDMKASLQAELGPRPWTWRKNAYYVWRIMLRVFVYGDTTAVRALFAAASLIAWFIYTVFPDTLQRPFFVEMRFLPAWAWGLSFLAHTLGVLWRFLDGPRMGWGFAVNAYGLFLWVFTTWLQIARLVIDQHELTPSVSMELAVIAAGFVALARNGLNDDVMSP